MHTFAIFRPLLVLFLVAGLSSSVTAKDGIEFFNGTWEEALKEARTQKRLIFVDAYTEWCGPCKAMARNTFTAKEVGDYFNENFINYAFDMEKGEGPMFASKYQVNAYPTLLFINHKGELIHRALGYKAPDAFLTEGRKANDPRKNEALQELKFDEGAATASEMLSYARNLKFKGEDYSEAAAKYFATQSLKDLRSAANWKAIQELSGNLNGPEFQYLLKKQKKFKKLYGTAAVNAKIQEVLRKETISAALLRKDAQYQKALSVADRLKDKGQMASYLKVVHAEAEKDWSDYAFKAVYHYDTYAITDAKELDQVVNIFTQKVDNPEQLAHARKWARQSVALQNAAFNNASYAELLLKLGDFQQALRLANKSVQLALQKEEDPAVYEALVDRIQMKMRE